MLKMADQLKNLRDFSLDRFNDDRFLKSPLMKSHTSKRIKRDKHQRKLVSKPFATRLSSVTIRHFMEVKVVKIVTKIVFTLFFLPGS